MLNVGNQFLLDVFYSIQGHSILFYSIRCILFCSILFYSIRSKPEHCYQICKCTCHTGLQMKSNVFCTPDLTDLTTNSPKATAEAREARLSEGHSRGPWGPLERPQQLRPESPREHRRSPNLKLEANWARFLFCTFLGGKLGMIFVLHCFFSLFLLFVCSVFCNFFARFFALFLLFFSRGKCKVFAFPEPQKKWVKSGGKNSRASKKVGEKLGEKKGGKSERPQTPTPKRALTVASWSRSVSPGPSSSRVRFMGCRVQPVQDGASHLRQKTPQDPFSWLWPCRLCSLQMLGLGELELEHRDSMYAGLACQICLVVLV